MRVRNAPWQTTQTAVATMKTVPTELFYNGTVSPIDINNVSSPADGTIQQIHFKYGQKVKSGDLLLVISSSKLQDEADEFVDLDRDKRLYLIPPRRQREGEEEPVTEQK